MESSERKRLFWGEGLLLNAFFIQLTNSLVRPPAPPPFVGLTACSKAMMVHASHDGPCATYTGMHTHACTLQPHTHTHTHIHTHMTHKHMYTHTHAHTHDTQTHVHTHIHTHTRTHTYAYTEVPLPAPCSSTMRTVDKVKQFCSVLDLQRYEQVMLWIKNV